ncbi:MAG: tRNA epoxyqueuosine(34) reductase QueG [Flavobacteriaceae bacterium]|nr:tRNA epoxyqueuosine(34) reductase QueG [Flavobacteriaceae bacterium]
MYDKTHITQLIKEKALAVGFDSCGVVRAEYLAEERPRLESWLNKDYQGDLSYLKRNMELRLDPRKLVEGTQSLIIVTLNYYTAQQQPECAPKVAKYAYGKDYHFIVKDKLTQILEYIQEIEPTASGRCFADSAPILEHAWATRAGLGWIGKNSLLLTPKGSYVFIGEILLNLELAYEENKMIDPCGKCTRCIDACPTQAIVADKVIDASRCISYFTIEQQGNIPQDVDTKNRVFGCDICQEVCPWNRKTTEHTTPELSPIGNLLQMKQKDWEELTSHEFGENFKGSPLKRAKYSGIKRSLAHINTKNSDESTNES